MKYYMHCNDALLGTVPVTVNVNITAEALMLFSNALSRNSIWKYDSDMAR